MLGLPRSSVFVALGLGALLQSSDVVFEIVRYAGAAYLLYLGVGMILGKGIGLESGDDTDAGEDGESSWAVFRQGFLTAVLNPKGLLLFLSLLPQFVTTSAAFPVGIQLLVLGLVHTVNCAIVYSAVGIGSSRLGEILKRRLGLARMIRWLAGSVLIALGLRLVFPGRANSVYGRNYMRTPATPQESPVRGSEEHAGTEFPRTPNAGNWVSGNSLHRKLGFREHPFSASR